MVSYIWTNFTLEWLRKPSGSTCTPNFYTEAATAIGALALKLKANDHDDYKCFSDCDDDDGEDNSLDSGTDDDDDSLR